MQRHELTANTTSCVSERQFVAVQYVQVLMRPDPAFWGASTFRRAGRGGRASASRAIWADGRELGWSELRSSIVVALFVAGLVTVAVMSAAVGYIMGSPTEFPDDRSSHWCTASPSPNASPRESRALVQMDSGCAPGEIMVCGFYADGHVSQDPRDPSSFVSDRCG